MMLYEYTVGFIVRNEPRDTRFSRKVVVYATTDTRARVLALEFVNLEYGVRTQTYSFRISNVVRKPLVSHFL